MIGGRDGEGGVLPLGAIVGKDLPLPRKELLSAPGLEIDPPGGGGAGGVVPVEGGDVVDQVSAGEDKNPLLSQRLQLLAEPKVFLRSLAHIDTELNDRHVGAGVDVTQDAPGAVIEPPDLIPLNPVGFEEIGDLLGQLW